MKLIFTIIILSTLLILLQACSEKKSESNGDTYDGKRDLTIEQLPWKPSIYKKPSGVPMLMDGPTFVIKNTSNKHAYKKIDYTVFYKDADNITIDSSNEYSAPMVKPGESDSTLAANPGSKSARIKKAVAVIRAAKEAN